MYEYFGDEEYYIQKVLNVLSTITDLNKNIKFYSSNGMSVVIVNNKSAYQVYFKEFTYNKVKNYSNLLKECNETYSLIKPIKYLDNLKTIVWPRIRPFNIMNIDEQYNLLTKNKNKLFNSIQTALKTLELKGMSHGDSRLDNIGITTDNNIVLFDYDGSSMRPDYNEDLCKFQKSYTFNLSTIKEQIKLLNVY